MSFLRVPARASLCTAFPWYLDGQAGAAPIRREGLSIRPWPRPTQGSTHSLWVSPRSSLGSDLPASAGHLQQALPPAACPSFHCWALAWGESVFSRAGWTAVALTLSRCHESSDSLGTSSFRPRGRAILTSPLCSSTFTSPISLARPPEWQHVRPRRCYPQQCTGTGQCASRRSPEPCEQPHPRIAAYWGCGQ